MNERNYLFRGDDDYRGESIGLPLGDEADAAEIQDFVEHVLRKAKGRTSRYTSFSKEIKVACRFNSAADCRNVCKADLDRLRDLETQKTIRIWDPDQVFDALRNASRKLAKRAADVRTAMKRNCEMLIEGQIPVEIIQQTE